MQINSSIKKGIIIIITISFLVGIFTIVPINQIIQSLKTANITFIVFSVLFFLCTLVLSAWRWKTILSGMTYEIPFNVIFNSYMAGLPAGSFTPSSVGDISRCFFIQNRVPKKNIAISVIFEKFMDLTILFIITIIGTFIISQVLITPILPLFLFIFLLSIPFLFLFYRSKNSIMQKSKNTLQLLSELIDNRKILILIIFQTILLRCFGIGITILLFTAFSVNVPFTFSIILIPLVLLIGSLPISIGGMGTRDAAFLYFFEPYAPASQIMAASIMYSVIFYWMPAIMGLYFIKCCFPNQIFRDGVDKN